MCRPKHVEQLRNTGIINSSTWSHLVGFFYEINGGYLFLHNTTATWEDGRLIQGTALALGTQTNSLGVRYAKNSLGVRYPNEQPLYSVNARTASALRTREIASALSC